MHQNFFWTLSLVLWLLMPKNAYGQDMAFFDKVDAVLTQQVQNGKVNYANLRTDPTFHHLIREMATLDPASMPEPFKKAFLINAYNLLVMQAVLNIFPTATVQSRPGFFDEKKYPIGGQNVSLNQLEKQMILGLYQDPRLHFVLVCAAASCPPLYSKAYRPEILDELLDQQTRLVLNDPGFVQLGENKKTTGLSQIFNWYSNDFGGQSNFLSFINRYRTTPIPEDTKITYYLYDWSLNSHTQQVAANSGRYVVSAAVPQGTSETKWFNNLYTQKVDGFRSSYFTSIVGFVYGVKPRFNVGFDLRYRMVDIGQSPRSPLEVFSFNTTPSSTQALATLGPKIRWAPFESYPSLSVQSAFWIPLKKDLAGSFNKPFLDWNGPSWWTQFFYDHPIGQNFSFFGEMDLFLEDIGKKSIHANRFSTPVTAILSYFPAYGTTLYAIAGFSPYWQPSFDYYYQAGLGAKYQFSANFEVELLYTGFGNQYLQDNQGRASTFNIGLRVNR